MSEAIERFAAFLQLSDKFLARAEREDLEECARILAVQCAHYRSKFGELSMSETVDVLASETMNDDQEKWIEDGFEIVVGVLVMLEQGHPKHQIIPVPDLVMASDMNYCPVIRKRTARTSRWKNGSFCGAACTGGGRGLGDCGGVFWF